WGLFAFTARRPRITALVLVVAMAGVGLKGISAYRQAAFEREEMLSMSSFLANSRPASLPIVISDPHLFFELSHYAPRPLRSRILYLPDVSLAICHTGTDSADFPIAIMGPAGGARISGFNAFLEATPEFLVYGYPSGAWGWVGSELAARQIAMKVAGE